MLRVTLLFALTLSATAADVRTPVEGDWTVPEFKFHHGETMRNLRLHYTTLGSPKNPAVLITHGTTGSGQQFMSANFAPKLFGEGQLLDAARFYIILPDAIGHGKSSRPSDGMHAKFPKYCYDDMVRAQYRLLTEGLGVKHARLVMGTSMGAMHTWMWGELYPDFMDALMPLASAPVEIGGRNRMMRKMIIDSLRNDPDYNGGEYKGPLKGMFAAQFALWIMTGSPLQLYKNAPTLEQADRLFERSFFGDLARRNDPNDMIYAVEASRDYNPSPDLEKINAPLYAINSADDQVNPPELGILEREIKRVKHGRFILLPITGDTRGHGTHTMPAIWGSHLAELLKESEPRASN